MVAIWRRVLPRCHPTCPPRPADRHGRGGRRGGLSAPSAARGRGPRTASPAASRFHLSKHLVIGLNIFALAGCAPSGLGTDWKKIEPAVEAPDFTLPQLDAKPLVLSSLRGQVVVMEFWATWCGPCRSSLPSLEAIYRKYRARGVAILLINQGDAAPVVRQWAERRFTAPILLDEGTRVGAQYGVHGIPRLFVIGTDGRLVYTHGGYGGGLERNLSLVLEELLAPHA